MLKVVCIKAIPTDDFIHKYIPVGEEMDVIGIFVIRREKCDGTDFVCQTDTEFFEEHFEFVLSDKK